MITNTLSTIHNALTKNRAEELGHDVWTQFVVPLFFDQIDLTEATKPRVVVGGRGCGKTMLLRYLSHRSQFSPQRAEVTRRDLEQIGVYWRADTQFVTAMAGRSVPEDVWESAFGHSLAISVVLEVTASLDSIMKSRLDSALTTTIDEIRFDALQAFSPHLRGSAAELQESLQQMEWEFQVWLNNPRTSQAPRFLPGREFPKAVIQIITSQAELLKETRFAVWIDEYENLRRYQQRIVNTYLKHSEPPLVFHLAMKPNGMQTKETVGEESITDIADYRTIDLDHLLNENDFAVFAAEILLSRLTNVSSFRSPVSMDLLENPLALGQRREQVYRKQVLTAVGQMLPDLTRHDLADAVFEDAALLEQLKRSIAAALKSRASTLRPDQFIRPEHKLASIIVPALLNRRNLSPEAVLAELKLLTQGKDNRFTGASDWIHNNFEGCLLYLYSPFDRTCPFYAGFNTFITLAQANLRHFLELCYKALKRIPATSAVVVVPTKEQAEAAKQASAAFVSEVKGFGRLGNRLYTFVLTLGSLFALSQRRPSQSEPEVSHFAVVGGDSNLLPEDEDFFREAVKWSVLLDHPQTKLKDPLRPFGNDWVLNPIYAPYFHITYRKRRKLDLKTDEVAVIIRGTYDQRRDLLKRFYDRWAIDPREVQSSLFPEAGE